MSSSSQYLSRFLVMAACAISTGCFTTTPLGGPVKGLPGKCYFTIPYVDNSLEPDVSGGITAAGPNAAVKLGKFRWVSQTYVGNCNDPDITKWVTNKPPAESNAAGQPAKPSPSPATAGTPAAKSQTLSGATGNLSQKVTKAGKKAKSPGAAPQTKLQTGQLLADAASYYKSVQRYANLKQADSNTVPVEKAIQSLEAASVAYTLSGSQNITAETKAAASPVRLQIQSAALQPLALQARRPERTIPKASLIKTANQLAAQAAELSR